MAATVQIREWNGAAPGSATDKTAGVILFQAADRSDDDLLYPVVKPSLGQTYSYEKWIRLYLASAPDGSITSPRSYSDGAGYTNNITLEAKVVGSDTGPNYGYVPPSDTEMSGGTDFFTYTSGSALAMDANTTPPYSGTGDIADFLVLQATVPTTATRIWPMPSETITIAFDET